MPVTLEALLEAGAHFGHQTRRWNPKMKPFIFAKRNGIHIIDLQRTVKDVARATQKAHEAVASGHRLLFVGTKKQAQDAVKEAAERCGQFYVTERWLGGMLTNFKTIKSSLKKLDDIESRLAAPETQGLTKRELLHLSRERDRLNAVLAGIRGMDRLPGVVFVVDTRRERIAVAEASKLGVPIIGILDTNSDPDPIEYPIAANDDAIKSIKLIANEIADAVIEGRKRLADIRREAEEKAPEEKAEGPRLERVMPAGYEDEEAQRLRRARAHGHASE